MQIQYLGTAAAEGWPSVFCHCAHCEQARKLGGKNIRTRSQALVDDCILIDFPCDTYMHALQQNIDLSKIGHLLITHSHTDHFYPAELVLRGGCYAHNMHSEHLHIYCNQAVKDYFYTAAQHELETCIEDTLHFHVIKPFDVFQIEGYTVTALPAQHMQTETALNYLIEKDNCSLFYAHDTGRLYQSVYTYFQDNHIVLDMVSLDCTCGALTIGENGGHMGFDDTLHVIHQLKDQHTIDEHTCIVLNHFSHNGGLLYDVLMEKGRAHGVDISYDGKIVTF